MLTQKQKLRTLIRKNRLQRSTEDFTAFALDFIEKLALTSTGRQAPSSIGLYYSQALEPGTDQLIKTLVEKNYSVFLPCCTENQPLTWRKFTTFAELTMSHVVPILEPHKSAIETDVHELPLVLIPSLAISYHGIRLGQGGGYYDRTFQKYSGIIATLVYHDEILPHVPHQKHDISVQYALTPHTMYTFL